MTTKTREANTAGSEVILWQDYTLGCSPAPYWGDRLDDDLQSLETAIFMVIFNSEIQTRVHIWYMSQTVGNIREAIVSEKCSFLNIVQKAFDPPPFYLKICPILQGVFFERVFEHLI